MIIVCSLCVGDSSEGPGDLRGAAATRGPVLGPSVRYAPVSLRADSLRADRRLPERRDARDTSHRAGAREHGIAASD